MSLLRNFLGNFSIQFILKQKKLIVKMLYRI
jgi:hypothetical protein